jgi:hypothetical protein
MLQRGLAYWRSAPDGTLKLPRPLLRPPLNDDLCLGEKFHRMPGLAIQSAKKAVLPPTEWVKSHRRRYTNINVNIFSLSILPKLTGCRSISGKGAGHIPIPTAVDQAEEAASRSCIPPTATSLNSIQNPA